MVEGRYLVGNQRGFTGDIQKEVAEAIEVAEEEDEELPDGNENLEMELREGVASSLGDLSSNGSFGGVSNHFHTVCCRKPMLGNGNGS